LEFCLPPQKKPARLAVNRESANRLLVQRATDFAKYANPTIAGDLDASRGRTQGVLSNSDPISAPTMPR
jgi:hypothetical protein